jgi:hypothetical protein
MIERAPEREAGPWSRWLGRAAVLVVALALGGAMAGCADIHPAGDDTGGGMLDAPDDEAVHDREISDEEAEHGQEEGGGGEGRGSGRR